MPNRRTVKPAGRLSTGLLAGAFLVCLRAPELPAQPVFGAARVVQGIKFYPDSASPEIYYHVPRGVEMKRTDDVPAFSFVRYRYVGTRSSGDAGEFRAKAVLSFTVRLDIEPSNLPAARSELNRLLGRNVSIHPLPIADVRSDVVYAAAGENGRGESGALGAGYWGDPAGPGTGEVWRERTFHVSADPQTADLLWQTYHQGAVILSLNVSVLAQGMTEMPRQGLAAGEVVTRTVMADALKIAVSPGRHPGLFRDLDLNERIPADYPFLDVYCHDFQGGERPDDLVAVDVVVRGSAAAGGDLVEERVRFVPEQPDVYKRQVHFRFAMNLDRGYAYRAVRTYGSGVKSAGDWKQVAYWDGMCDVTEGETPGHAIRDARPLDARMLY